MLEVPLILFLVIVAPIWIIAHYTTRWRMAKTLSPEDEKQFAELWQIAERMEERIDNIERILDRRDAGRRRRPGAAARSTSCGGWPMTGEQMPAGPSRRRLYRDARRGWIAGVCAGIADYFGREPVPGAGPGAGQRAVLHRADLASAT